MFIRLKVDTTKGGIMLSEAKPITDDLVSIKIEEKLESKDYKAIKKAIFKALGEKDQIKLLVEANDFSGWSPSALWEELKLGLDVNKHIKKIGLISDKKTDKWLVTFARPFTHADTRYFSKDEREMAMAFLTT